MFGYSIKEILEDNLMDIYMIMETLNAQKIQWYLKQKGSDKLTNACYAVRNPDCDNYFWFATFGDYLKGRKIIRNHKAEKLVAGRNSEWKSNIYLRCNTR